MDAPTAPTAAAPHDGDAFHAAPERRIYDGEAIEGRIALTKRGARMARVAYWPAHPNPDFPEGDARAGHGEAIATWVLSEQAGTAEGLLAVPLEILHDTRFAPFAAIGLHVHDTTEEVYYILDGSIEMTTTAPDGRAHTARLEPGDAHVVRLGQAHHGQVGADGCRMIVVSVRRG